MAVSGAPGQAPGAWVTAGQPSDVEEMQIAGARIRNNGDGLPEVVARGSHPAAAAVPLRTGDVIVSVNGKSIAALAGLELFYQPLDAGAEVTLVVRRSGREETVRFRKPNDR
jgi:S1-C subfamily serine protease